LHRLATRVVGVSADDPAPAIAGEIRRILQDLGRLLDAPSAFTNVSIEIDDTRVGGGYGIATPASTEATELCARREALFLDPTYTAKAMAGLMALSRARTLKGTTLFWHTGGQVALFA
jgi:1-aminocyclopropane-1-carboxylate deaminase/D-cysteine desulfhydrase-like pyridoxal-dependent ACC family enzyme